VPRAGEILALWQDTLAKLEARDLAALAPRLDWALKLSFLMRAMQKRPDLGWESPQIKHLDHLYSSLDATAGLYWACETSGRVERVVTEAEVERLVHDPPEDTRAWTRAMLLRAAGPEIVDDVNWDMVRFKTRAGRYWSSYQTFDLANPLAFTRAQTERTFAQAATLEELLDGLGEPSSEEDTHRARTTGREQSAHDGGIDDATS
jgi:proteasome accessory factor A